MITETSKENEGAYQGSDDGGSKSPGDLPATVPAGESMAKLVTE